MLYMEYSRSYLKLAAVLADCGGTYSSLYLIGFGFTVLFSYNLFLSSIIRKLYYFKPRFESEKLTKKKKKQDKKGSDSDVQLKKQDTTIDNEKLLEMKKTYALEAEAKKTGKDQIKKAF